MKIIFPSDSFENNDLQSSIACIGNFDGVHLGHRKLIKSTVDKSKKENIPAVVITFEPHPSVLFASKPVSMLTTLDARLKIFEELGIDYCYIFPFNEEFARLSAKEFALKYLKQMHCKELIVGYDFTMGSDKCDNINLKSLLQGFSCSLQVHDEVILNSHNFPAITISSSAIRKALLNGEIELANAMLGRDYSICGKVVHGAKRGSTALGFPTANIENAYTLLPQQAVYATSTSYLNSSIENGKKYKSISNIGYNPTFAGDTLVMETNILDFNKDIYDEEICISFHEKLREEKKFNEIKDLIEQLNKDKNYRLKMNK